MFSLEVCCSFTEVFPVNMTAAVGDLDGNHLKDFDIFIHIAFFAWEYLVTT